jgi:anti-sigma factor RsiW
MSGTGTGTGPEHPGDLLTAYLDDEVTAGEAAEVEAHLVRCATCSAELDELTDARRLLRSLPVVRARAELTRRLVERRRRADRRGAGLALVAASVAAVLGIAVADPGADRPGGRAPLSLTSDSSRFAPLGSQPDGPRAPEADGQGSEGQGSDGPSTVDGPPTSEGTGPTTTTVDAATGAEEDSDPVTVGDRLEDAAASLLRLIGGG